MKKKKKTKTKKSVNYNIYNWKDWKQWRLVKLRMKPFSANIRCLINVYDVLCYFCANHMSEQKLALGSVA